MFSNPVFQFGIFGTIVGTIAVLLVLRSQVQSRPVAVARGTRIVLTMGVLSMLLVSGWSGWNVLTAQGQQSVGPTSSPPTRSSLLAGSPTTPTEEPSPTPTPHLSRSITQVLTTFCQEITARDYVAAWNVFTTDLQLRHPYTAVVTDWRRYSACRVADQGGDPEAISVLIFTLVSGWKDQYGFTGDTYLQFTMAIQAQTWKIMSVCHQIAEGCFSLVWG